MDSDAMDDDLKCPGSSNSTIEFIDCTNCGADIETFSDDPKAACAECGEVVFKESNPSCVAWCDHATLCVGEERYHEIMDALREQGVVDEDGNLVEDDGGDEDDAPDEMDLDLSL